MAENTRRMSDVWAGPSRFLRHKERRADALRRSQPITQPDISIDYAVMEKAEKISMVPAGFGWSDVGSGCGGRRRC